jgi:DNA-binding MarR family transcriptional regulator
MRLNNNPSPCDLMKLNPITTNQKPTIYEFADQFEVLFPGLNAAFMLRFAGTMLRIHSFMMLTESYFQSAGTSKGRFIVLVRLLISKSPEGESISSIRPFYPISNAALSGILDTLERDAMIERLPNPSDRRKVNIRITEPGRRFIMGFLPKHLQNVKTMSAFVTDEEISTLSNIVQKLIHGVELFLSKETEYTDPGMRDPEAPL